MVESATDKRKILGTANIRIFDGRAAQHKVRGPFDGCKR